jgi:hypothetical protein
MLDVAVLSVVPPNNNQHDDTQHDETQHNDTKRF